MFEIRENPDHGAHILRYFINNINHEGPLLESHTKFLMNFSNLFYGNLYVEDRNSLSKHNAFVQTFNKFMSHQQYKKDSAENVVIANPMSLKVIKILFEGQTRKMSANNFLRHIYAPNFSKIFVS